MKLSEIDNNLSFLIKIFNFQANLFLGEQEIHLSCNCKKSDFLTNLVSVSRSKNNILHIVLSGDKLVVKRLRSFLWSPSYHFRGHLHEKDLHTLIYGKYVMNNKLKIFSIVWFNLMFLFLGFIIAKILLNFLFFKYDPILQNILAIGVLTFLFGIIVLRIVRFMNKTKMIDSFFTQLDCKKIETGSL